jgi:hypothetical protein
LLYELDPGFDATMMNTSVLSHVAPNIRKQLRESACLILGTDLMWLICSSVADEYIPSDFKRVFFWNGNMFPVLVSMPS